MFTRPPRYQRTDTLFPYPSLFRSRDSGMGMVGLNSGEQRYIRSECMATIGAVSNPDNQNQNLAKAGRNRWLGKRPLTRGVAKNPVDHPHGGGEGRTSGGDRKSTRLNSSH